MDFLHRFILYIHITSVILSIGPFFVLFPIVKKLRVAEGNVQEAYISTFRSAVRLAKHAGHVLVGSGIVLVYLSSWSWSTSWLLMTILILVCSLYFLARAFSPVLRKLAELDEKKELLSNKLNRAVWIYLALLLIMLWLMVTKPILW
jgi:uncharacterized membrane protein